MKGISKISHAGEAGQVLLITLLVLSIATTVVLGVIGRTNTDLAISNKAQESAQAFSAAEAGVEQALRLSAGQSTSGDIRPGVITYSAAKTPIGNTGGTYKFPKKTTKGTTETLWLANHRADGTLDDTVPGYLNQQGNPPSQLTVCWSDASPTPAVVVTVFSRFGTFNQVRKFPYDPVGARAAGNKFNTGSTLGTCGLNEGSIYWTQIIPILSTPSVALMVRIRPVFGDSQIAVAPIAGATFPAQGSQIVSTGQVTAGATRKIIVVQQYTAPLGVFDHLIYSQGSFQQ